MAVEIERKYIIEMPPLDYISTLSGYSESAIVQTYLLSVGAMSSRVRRREFQGRVVLTQTKKVKIDGMSAEEDEREISEEEYARLMEEKDTALNPIKKVRYTFGFDGFIYEIDVYPEWKNTAIMEVELSDRDEQVNVPSFIKIIKEVTGDRRYSNHSMAKCFPEEEK